MITALGGHSQVVEELLKYGGVEITDCRGQSPLHVAAYHGESECVKLLCAHAAQIAARYLMNCVGIVYLMFGELNMSSKQRNLAVYYNMKVGVIYSFNFRAFVLFILNLNFTVSLKNLAQK